MRFAMNHIATPKTALPEFFEMAKRLGATEVEIRNDLPDVMGTWAAADVKAAAEAAGVTILSINALYPFNVWSGELPAKALKMADYAAASGAKALVMCPLNEGRDVAFEDLVAALKAIKPILEERGLIGLVEPLGFPVSSLRKKSVAIEAIKAADGEGRFRLLHDTFHHHLASETEVFPAWTELVHISGVTDAEVSVDAMLDAHRALVDAQDRLENIEQIKALEAAGYQGAYSFEPFATEVHDLPDIETALAESIALIKAAV